MHYFLSTYKKSATHPKIKKTSFRQLAKCITEKEN